MSTLRTPIELIEAGVRELEPTLGIFIPLLSSSIVVLEIIEWNILVSKKYNLQYNLASILNLSCSIDFSRVLGKEVLPI